MKKLLVEYAIVIALVCALGIGSLVTYAATRDNSDIIAVGDAIRAQIAVWAESQAEIALLQEQAAQLQYENDTLRERLGVYDSAVNGIAAALNIDANLDSSQIE